MRWGVTRLLDSIQQQFLCCWKIACSHRYSSQCYSHHVVTGFREWHPQACVTPKNDVLNKLFLFNQLTWIFHCKEVTMSIKLKKYSVSLMITRKMPIKIIITGLERQLSRKVYLLALKKDLGSVPSTSIRWFKLPIT